MIPPDTEPTPHPQTDMTNDAPTTNTVDSSRTSSPTRSVTSVISNTSSLTRRRRVLELKKKKAEQLAAIERKLIEETIELEILAAEADDDGLEDDDRDFDQQSTRQQEVRSATKKTFEKPEVRSASKIFEKPEVQSAPYTLPNNGRSPEDGRTRNDNSVLNKFITRQTCATELPTFSGAPEEWPLFISIFNTTTRVCGYTDDENIARLVKALRGEARESVLALLVSSTNVERIVNTLQLRFGRPAQIIEIMLAKIRHMRDIRPDDFNQLLKYATDLQNIVATMIATGQRGHLTNPTLVKEMLCKLPSTLKYQWGIDKARRDINEVTLEHVADWLMSVASATTDLMPTQTPSTSYTSRFPERKPMVRPDRHPIMTSTKNDNNNIDKKCHRCNGNHELAKCPDFLRLTMDERWQYVTESRLCFSCLSAKHQMKTCKKKAKCKTSNCERFHHTVLHAEPVQSDDIDTSNVLIAQTTTPSSAIGGITTNAPVNQYIDGQPVLLKVMRVVINTDKGDIETTALLDEGATVSLIDASLAARAGFDGPTKPLRICGARGMTSTEQTSKMVTFKIRGSSSNSFFTISNVRTVNNLNLPVNSMCYKSIVKKFPMLTDYFNDTDLTLDKPKLLLGQDNIDLIVTRQVIRGPKDGPMVSQTKLGYVLHGRCGRANLTEDASILNICSCDQLNETLKHHFKLDDFGIKRDTKDFPRSREDMKALEIMQQTTRRIGDRYETGLLWRDDAFDSPLPNSYCQAKQRLRGVDRKIVKLPEFGKRYQEKIDDYLAKGYATKLTPEEARHKTAKMWYLPHFAVFNPNKPNKLRFVLDAAAKTDGRSLNSFLLPGPDLLNPLPGVLLIFRCHQFAVMGDIREFFHQVQIVEEDRAAQRFLWGKDEYKMNVMIFGAVCSPSCAQYVKNLNAERYRETHPRAVEAIVRRHYMDDFIDSTTTEEDAIKLIKDVTWIHETGGFTMSSIMSNSKEVLRHIPQDRLAPSAVKVISEDGEQTIERVLGVHWNPECDSFLFKLNFHSLPEDLKTGVKKPTKRDVLKVTMSVFDPLGFLLHIVMKARILLQDTWRLKIGWDDEVTTELYERWQIWLKDLNDAASIRIPRWFLTTEWDPAIPLELHIFCDASARAYVSIAYLRSRLRSGDFHVAMVMAKGRVAPLKQISIPRLELQAALIGARIAQKLKENIDLPIAKIVFWSDSKTVLSWIRSDVGRFKPFVAHRISEIGELTQPDEWRWVPTHLNNADDATRENSIDSSRWIHGPDFLRQAEEFWPVESNKLCELSQDDPEVAAIHLIITKDGCLPDENRFSKYWRLIRATAWILRVQHNCTHQNDRRKGELLPDEISEAEKMWIKESQKRYFSKEIHSLRSNRNVAKDSSIYTLTPFLDASGVLRVSGRTQTSAVLSEDAKNPMILHPKDKFVKLLIDQYHRDAAHIEKEAVLSNTRQRFWILKGRSAVNAAWRDCQVCKNNRAKPNPPLMGQLPPERLTPTFKVFEYTGLDYFGPVTIKIGRRQEKRYVALFTCMTVRAIHLEIINDLSASSAIMGIRRFIARRGTPKEIWSDNATAFRGADRELQEAAAEMQIREFASVHRLHWKFIPPNAPHFGGCWERLIRSVKRALGATLKERVPTEPTLNTLLLEAEYIINSRPLTHLSLDHRDSPALTPNCFIFGTRTDSNYYPFGDFDERDLLTRTWRESQRLADLLWRRWVKEYLPTLTRRTNWYRNTEPLKVDDVVVVTDDQLARSLWPKGIVTRVFVGSDGQVRVAEVKTATGTYKRPVTKLCKLDVTVTCSLPAPTPDLH